MNFFKEIWNDPVGSKLIAQLLYLLLAALAYRLSSRINWKQILKSIVAFFTKRIPLWICFLSMLVALLVFHFIFQR
jgi:hypothetical protein